MKITFEPKVENYASNTKARLVISVSVDGIACGGVTVCSGFHPDDVHALLEGKIELGDLNSRTGQSLRHDTLPSDL